MSEHDEEREAMLDEVRQEIAQIDPGDLADSDDMRIVTRLARSINALRAEIATLNASHERRTHLLKMRIEAIFYVLGGEARRIIERHIEQQASRGKKRPAKYLDTQWGRVAMRRTPEKLSVVNEQQLFNAGLIDTRFEDCIDTSPRVSLSGCKKAWEATGMVPPGMVVEPAREELEIKDLSKKEM